MQLARSPLPIAPQDLGRVEALLAPVAAAHGVELCAVEWATGPAGRILRVIIDRAAVSVSEPSVGVSLEDCVRVSRDASAVLDTASELEGHYRLEVSSPGADRPLGTERDYQRNVGRVLRVKLRTAASDGQRVLRGPLLAVGADTVRLDVDGNEHVVSLAEVEEARVVIDFGRSPRGGEGKRTVATRRRKPARPDQGTAVRGSHPASPKEQPRSKTSRGRDGRS